MVVYFREKQLYLGGNGCTSGEETLYLGGKNTVLRGKKHCTSGEIRLV